MLGVYLFLLVLTLFVVAVARLGWDVIILEQQARRRLEDDVRYLDRRVSALEQLCHRKPHDHEEARR